MQEVVDMMSEGKTHRTAVPRGETIWITGASSGIGKHLPRLRAGDRGHIVALASQASRVPFPRAQAYGSPTAALTYLLESLGVNLYPEGIDVTVVQLGFVDTPMTAGNDFPMPFLMTAPDAAEQLLMLLEGRPRLVRFPKRLSWLIGVGQRLPGLWYRYIAPKLSRSTSKRASEIREM